jgi:hypothetical protein
MVIRQALSAATRTVINMTGTEIRALVERRIETALPLDGNRVGHPRRRGNPFSQLENKWATET